MRAERANQLSLHVAAAVFLCLGTAAAQEVPKLQLRVRESVPAPNLAADAVLEPVRCDAAGNIYVRVYQALRPLAAPITKISPKGERLAVFTVASVPGFEQANFEGFEIGPRGEVYIMAIGPREGESAESARTLEERYELDILAFRQDGSYLSKTRLDRTFSPMQLAIFPTGEFLVTGFRSVQGDSGTSVEPFTGIFDRGGRLLEELTLSNDVQATKHGATEKEEHDVRSAVSLGTAVVGEDGNIYLKRGTPEPLVYVISAGGEVLRAMSLASPGENLRALTTMKVSGGRLAIFFGEKEPAARGMRFTLSEFDAETGRRLADYYSEPGLGSMLACYTPNRLIFLGTDPDGRTALVHAEPR